MLGTFILTLITLYAALLAWAIVLAAGAALVTALIARPIHALSHWLGMTTPARSTR